MEKKKKLYKNSKKKNSISFLIEKKAKLDIKNKNKRSTLQIGKKLK